LDGTPVKKVQKISAGVREGGSAKPKAIVLAGLKLFTQYGYRKTAIDDIAQAAQVSAAVGEHEPATIRTLVLRLVPPAKP